MIGYVTSPLFKTTKKLLWQTVNNCMQNLKKLNHRKQMNPLSTSLTWQFIKVHCSGIVLVPTSAITILCYSWFTRSALDTGWSSTSGFLKSWGLCCISLFVLCLWSSLAEETTIPLVEFTIYHFPKILVCDACLQEQLGSIHSHDTWIKEVTPCCFVGHKKISLSCWKRCWISRDP